MLSGRASLCGAPGIKLVSERRADRHVRHFGVEHGFGLVRFGIGFLVQVPVHALYVQVARPLRHHQRGDAVADQVGQCARFGHETVNAQNQGQTGHRHRTDGRQRGRQHDKAAARHARCAF